MHNMVMAMKAAHESAGIGSYPAKLQDDAQRSGGAPVRPDTTSRLKELLNQTLTASAKADLEVSAIDEARFASSAFKHGPAATYVPLPSRWSSIEAENFPGEAQNVPAPFHSEGIPLHPSASPNSRVYQGHAVEAAEYKTNKRVFESSDAKASSIANTPKFDMMVDNSVASTSNRPGSPSPDDLSPKSVGPSPSSILRRAPENLPCAPTFKTVPVIKSSSRNKISSITGANGINEKTKFLGGKKQQSGSMARNSQHNPPKQRLPGGIKLPSAVAKLLPEASTNFP